jgi:hypothetical protein
MRMLAAIVIGITLTASPALARSSTPGSYSLRDTIGESLFGDVYAEPSRWQPLSAGTFFTEGWRRPWTSPPAGEGGAPRQGWLNAFVSANLNQPIDDRGSKDTVLTLTPGFRTHLGANWYLLGGVEVPVTARRPSTSRSSGG